MDTAKRKGEIRILVLSVLALAWPTMLEQALQTVVQYIDAAMVGRIGPDATATIGITNIVTWLINSPLSAMGVGFMAYIAQSMGAGKPENARRAAQQSVFMVLFLGILEGGIALSISRFLPKWMGLDEHLWEGASLYFAIVCLPMLFRAATAIFSAVLRSVKDTRTPMIVNIMVNLVNIVLNFFLIYEPGSMKWFGITIPTAGLGVTGAGIATALSYMAGGILMTAALFKHKEVSPRGMKFRLDSSILKPCIRIGTPVALSHSAACLGQVVFTSIVTSLGTVAFAAHSIALTAEQMFYIPGYGMQAVASTLSGNAVGARDERRLKQITRVLVCMVFLMMGVTGAMLFLGAGPLMSFFTPDKQAVLLGTKVLRICALSEPIFGIYIILEGIFDGVGDTVRPFFYSLIGMWGVRILSSFIGVNFLNFGLTEVWISMVAHNVFLSALFSVRYFRGRWNPLKQKKFIVN
jgi:putative MATE family efflux protein